MAAAPANDDGSAALRVRAWLEGAVIGMDLCPFAAPVHRRGQVRIVVSDATGPDAAVHDALAEAQHLLDADPEELATTLVVLPRALTDLYEFLDAAATVEAALVEAGAEGVLQVATFHPDYLFEGEPADDVSHWTNRAPHPVLHLIREDDIEQALARHPDPEGIPATNVARLRELGLPALRELWAAWGPEAFAGSNPGRGDRA